MRQSSLYIVDELVYRVSCTKWILSAKEKRWERIKLFTKLPKKEFLHDLDVILNSLYLQCDEEYYQQVNGAPIGLSISPISADLVLQEIETTFLKNYEKSIYYYCRYVDDSFIIIIKN